MAFSRRVLPVFALVLAAAACESDMEPEEALSEEEAVALLKGAGLTLAQVLEDSTLIVVNDYPDSLVSRCPLGGQAKLVGTLTEELGDTARLGADFLITPNGCVIAADGIQFTVDPGPALRYQLLVEIIAATFEFLVSGAITGGVDWTLDDRTGNCAMDLTLEAVPNLADPENPLTGAYKGMLCGHEVEIDAGDLLVVDL